MDDDAPVPLADAAAVEPDREGRYLVNLAAQFTVLGRPHGGYLQCVMANAALASASDAGASHLHATAVTTNFISAPAVGPAVLDTRVRRVGRGASFVHVTMSQDDLVTTEALVTLGVLKETSRLRYQSSPPPQIAPRDECIDLPTHEVVSFRRSLDLRGDPASHHWWIGDAGPAEIKLWMKLTDEGSPWDAWSLHFALDSVPPATLPLGSTGWVPSLQLTTYVRRVPSSEWLRARQWCVVVADDLVDERCELFDDRNELVASASQLAMVRFAQA